MSRPAASPAPGSLVLNRYLPIRPLGSGGSGSVWLAREVASGREVALKIVPREGTAGSRAEREAAAAARLRHPRCLRAHALARDADHVYIVYEYVPGRTLRDALRDGKIDDAGALEAAAQVLEGLAHAHAHGIVHRDVKPANVLLADGRGIAVKLFDFGLALVREAEGLTAAGDIPGTLAYISPERLRGESAGPPADVWAVGVLLWEALAGFHPFWGGTLLDTAKAIERGAPSLREQRPDLPRPLVACVDRALSSAPDRRPTAASLAGALRQAKGELRRRRRSRRTAPARGSRPLRLPLPALRLPARAIVARGARTARPAAGLRRPTELAARALGAAAAGTFAGGVTAAAPFFPERWPAGIGAVAALLALRSERAGLLFALAVPILPLGNHALGLAVVYALVALAAAALAWRAPRAGLAALLGAALGPAGSLGLAPVTGQAVARPLARGLAVATSVYVAAGLDGAAHLGRLGIADSNRPTAAARALASAAAAHPALAATAAALGLGAALLPQARRRGLAAALAYLCLVTGIAALPGPHAPEATLLAFTAATAAALGLEPYAALRRRLRPPRPGRAVEETTVAVVRPPGAPPTVARSAGGRG